MTDINPDSRRDFLLRSSMTVLGTATLGSALTPVLGNPATREEMNVFGPRKGFTPQIGTLVSMLTWMRNVILMPVRGMRVKDLDYLLDDSSNSIGAMLWHLAATERFYQIHTFEGRKWGDWDNEDVKNWGIASGLGADARRKIKGNNLDFYLEKLEAVREGTLQELKNRDDDWLMSVDKDWFWGPTNNYCKWFHVCEHESNHNGQFKYIKSRLPS